MTCIRRAVNLPLAAVVCVLVVAIAAATPRVAAAESLPAAAPQDSSAPVEVSLALDRSTRRLLQQGLRNEGFDPGTPDGLFGPRTRAAILGVAAVSGSLTDGVPERRGSGASANGRGPGGGIRSSPAGPSGARRRPQRLVGRDGIRLHAGGDRLQSDVASRRCRRRTRRRGTEHSAAAGR